MNADSFPAFINHHSSINNSEVSLVGMTFAYIVPPDTSGGQKTIWLHTKVCPKCGLVQTYVKEPELFEEKW